MGGRTVSFEFDPFQEAGIDLPDGADKADVLEAVQSMVLDETLSYMDRAVSPVAGHGAFPKLTKEYRKRKLAAGGSGSPDLELTHDMKDAIKVSYRGNKIKIRITGKQGAKADGHCNFSGESELPLRRFIPNADDDETFKAPILSKMKKIIREGGK